MNLYKIKHYKKAIILLIEEEQICHEFLNMKNNYFDLIYEEILKTLITCLNNYISSDNERFNNLENQLDIAYETHLLSTFIGSANMIKDIPIIIERIKDMIVK